MGPRLEHYIPEGLQTMEGTRARAVHEQLQPVGRIYIGEVHGGGERFPPLRKMQQQRPKTPIPISLALLETGLGTQNKVKKLSREG